MRTRLTVLSAAGAAAVLLMLVGCSQARSQATAVGQDAVAPPAQRSVDADLGLPFTGLGPDVAYAPTSEQAGIAAAWRPPYFPEEPGPPTLPDGAKAATVEFAGGDLEVGIVVLWAPDAATLEAPYREVAPEGASWSFDAPAEGPGLSGALVTGADGAGWLLLAGAKAPVDSWEAVARMRRMVPVSLPAGLEEWALTEPTTYDPKTIFDYIDGAAEKHLRFGFEAMYGGRYARGDDKVLVDVYRLPSGPDAFGLFSCLAKGTPSDIGQESMDNGRQLYLRQGCYYIEVRAGTRGVDLSVPMREIARRIVESLGPGAQRPLLVRKLGSLASDLTRVHFFHQSNEQMNYFYLSTTDVLHLGPSANGVLVMRGEAKRPEVLLVVAYPQQADLDAALSDSIGVIRKPGETLTQGEPYEWDKGRFVFIPKSGDLPPRTLVAVLDATEPAAARSLAEEAVACLR